MSALEVDVEVPGRLRVALTCGAGERVVVLGPNGAGKTTLLHSIAGLLGEVGPVRVDGVDWTGLPVRERRVGLAFQGPQLFPHLSALANVAFGPRSRGRGRREAQAVAREWLDRFGVGALAGRRPSELSGGQAQRVALARALATDPAVLLLDEPFAGLDVGVAAALRHELAAHLRAFDGVTLLVSHEAIDAQTLASRVLVVEDGAVLQDGTPGEVAARPATDHVARLVGLNVVHDAAGDTLLFRPSEVTVSRSEPESSARLRWPGVVGSVWQHGDVVRLEVATEQGPRLLADVTGAAAVELGLAVGAEVWLAVKATATTTG